ncbi:MAG: GYD domain-containing protein [Acidimicrobiia bacterium]
MPKFLLRGSYTVDGANRLVEQGGSKRRQQVEEAVNAAGGRLEALYWALGEDDVILIADVPTTTAMAALSLASASAGLIRPKTVMLMTAEEVDEAARQSGDIRAPGT